MAESCPGLVAQRERAVRPRSASPPLKEGEARINYIGHSTFLIESPKLIRIATTSTTTSSRRSCPTSSP